MRGASTNGVYKHIFENAREGIVITDEKTGVILECNRAFARQTGWKKTELVGKPRAEILINETRTDKKTSTVKSKSVQTILLTKGGESRPVEVKAKRFNKDGQKGIIEFVHVLHDSNQQLEQTNQILLKILDSIDADVYVADMQTYEILFANKHMRDGFGQQLAGKTCYEVFQMEAGPCTYCKNDLLLDKRGRPTGVQVWGGYNPVVKRWYSNADRAIRWQDGRMVRLQVSLDITERELAVQGLRESEERYRDLVENIQDLISTFDLEGNLISVNQAAIDLTGYSADEIIGHNLREFLAPEAQQFFNRYLRELKRKGEAEGLLKIRTKSGDTQIWHYHNTLKDQGTGAPVVRGYARDITEQLQAQDAVKASEKRLKMTQQIAKLGSWELDLIENHLTWSDEVYRIFGIQPEDFETTYEAFLERVHPEDREVVDQTYKASIQHGRDSYEIEHRIVRKDNGEVRNVYEKCEHLRDQEGRIVRSIGIVHDITERKRNEDELFHSRQMLQLILDNVPQRIFWKDRESRYLGCNKPFADDAGLGNPEQILGMDDYQLSWKENAILYRSDDREVMEKGISKINYEEPQNRTDKEQLWLRTSKVPLRNQANEIFGVMGVYEDINDRRKAEEALRFEKERAQHYLDIAGGVILALDLDGNVTLINKKGLEILGYEEHEVLGKNWMAHFVPEDDRATVWEVFQEIVKGNTAQYVQVASYILSKSGQKFFINWHNSLLRDEQGNVIGTLSSGGDITERKRMEDDLRRRADELAALQETLLGITSRHSLPELLQLIVERAVNLLEGSGGGLYLTEPEARLVRCVVSYKTKRDYVGTALSYGEGAAGYIAETGSPLIIDDYRTWTGRASVFEKDQPFQALVGTPLLWQDSVTGVLHVLRDREDKTFTQEDLILLTLFANHAAVAVENARLYSTLTQELTDRKQAENEVRRQMAELETLYETGMAISRLLEPNAIGEKIIASFSQHLAWHHVAIRLRRGDSDELEIIAFNQPELPEKEKTKVREKFNQLVQRVGQGMSGWVMQTGETARLGDVHDHPSYVETYRGIRSGVYVPLKIGRRILGCIAVESEDPEAFTEQDERLLETLAAHAAAAFENARLYQDVQLELIERKRAEDKLLAQTRELEALFSISTHLRSAQNIDEMLPMVLAEMQRVLSTDANAVLFPNKETTEFTCALGNGAFQECGGMTINADDGIGGFVYPEGQAGISDDLAGDDRRIIELKGAERLGPAIFVPIFSEDEILGVLIGARERKPSFNKFTNRELRLLSAVGEMVGNALRRMRLFDEALKRMHQVQALHSVDMAIASSIDAKTALEIILSQAVAQLSADAAAVLLFRPETQILEYASLLGFRYQEIRKLQLWPGEGLAGEVVQGREIFSIMEIEGIQNVQAKALALEKIRSYHAVPMFVKGQVRGVLEIFYRTQKMLDEDQVEFLKALAAQAAIAIDNAELFSNLQRSNLDLILAYDATIEGWSQALDLRDRDREGHTQRVTELTLTFAREMGLQDELNQIRWGALLHDIGKIGIPDRILFKTSDLTEEELRIMQEHPLHAYRMISPIEFLHPALDIPYCHHEKWDGTGYPRGLKGEEIPLAARIFAVVDVWDAITSDRPHRKARSREEALAYLQSQAGKHFDPRVVEVFTRKIQAEDNS
jgi:PAS domain S-box-containing protein